MLCADENFFPWIDICAIQINKIINYYYCLQGRTWSISLSVSEVNYFLVRGGR